LFCLKGSAISAGEKLPLNEVFMSERADNSAETAFQEPENTSNADSGTAIRRSSAESPALTKYQMTTFAQSVIPESEKSCR
jgi:hypothetical protein